MSRKLLFIIPVLFYLSFSVTGQVSDNYQYPLGLKWRWIRSEHFDVIFPQAIVNDAQRVVNTLEHVYEPLYSSLQRPPKRYPLILSNQNVEANGYVRLMPRKSEFYSTPPQGAFIGTGDWYSMLAIHEGRHMVQYDRLNSGLIRIPSIILGQLGTEVATAYYFPLWLWEGDAVATETALSSTGRGRLPEFDRDLRAIVLSNQKFSYYKAYNRSYKDYYPNHYVLGYHMVTHIRRQGNENTLNRVVRRTSRSFVIPHPISRGLRKETRVGLRSTYANTMLELDSLWSNQLAGLTFTNFTEWDANPKTCWTSYDFPQYISDNSVITQKYGFDHGLTLVKLNKDGKEEKLFRFQSTEQLRMSFSKNRIAWSEAIPSVRWGNRNYSVIRTYDLQSGRKKRITSRSKLFAPALSSDGSKIVAVEFDTKRKSALIVIDSERGEELLRLPNPENRFISTPCWSANDKKVVFISQKNNEKYLSIQDVESGSVKDIAFGNENITNPIFFDKYILYNSPYSSIDNIYAIDTATNERFQVTSDRVGAYNPTVSPDGKRLSYATYTIKGFDIAESPLDPASWKKLVDIQKRDIGYYKPLVKQEKVGDVISDIPDNKYEVSRYPFFNGLKPHSWFIVPLPPVITLVSTLSTDLLNNTSLSFSGLYNGNENTYAVGAEGRYSGLFPIISFGAFYTTKHDSVKVDFNQYIKDSWIEESLYGGITLPFDFSRGVYTRRMEMSAKLKFVQVIGKDSAFDIAGSVNDGYMFPLTYGFTFLNYKNGSVRDFNPPLAQIFNLDYTHTPFTGVYKGEFLSARSTFYFPGFFKHHSIRLCGNYEKQLSDNYLFSSNFLFPRGYQAYYMKEMMMGSIDYTFPLFYPDWSIPHVMFIKRFKGNFYYDYGYGYYNQLGQNSGQDKWYNFRSAGAAITMNFIPISLPPNYELEIGVRFSYLFDKHQAKNYSIDPVLLSIYF